MFIDFFFLLKKVGIPVTLTEWLALTKALDMGVVEPTLDHFYHVARATLVKDEAFFDHFDQAFAHYFKDADEPSVLKDELLKWLAEAKKFDLSPEQLAMLEKLDMDELKRLFEERLREQTEQHDGGNRWIGTGGTSPFGHSGFNPQGIRVGGEGRNRSAVQVAHERRYRDYRHDILFDTRQIVVALKKLRILKRIGQEEELDIDETIDKTCRNAGDIDLVFNKPRKNNVKLLLLMDVGGTMDPFSDSVEKLFSAAHQSNHFKDFKYFYFHNCVYENMYEKADMQKPVPVAELFQKLNKDYRVIFVGDAFMDPGELLDPGGSIYYYHRNETPGIEWLRQIKNHFYKCVWLNPEEPRYWTGTTIEIVHQLFKMYPLTLDGLQEAVQSLV